MAEKGNGAAPGAAFREGFVEADGFRIRYAEAGDGPPLVHLHGAGGLRLSPRARSVGEEVSRDRVRDAGLRHFGREHPHADDGRAGADDGACGRRARPRPLQPVGHLDRRHGRDLAGGAAAGAASPRWCLRRRRRSCRPATPPASGTPEQMARILYGHPERMPPMPARDPAVLAKQGALVGRLRATGRDPDLEARMRKIDGADPGAVGHARPADPVGDGPHL